MLPGGARVGKYQIGEQLGSGSYGVIYRAKDAGLGREVALKVLRPQHVARPDLVGRFLREARAAASVNHPGIVTVFECGVDDSTPGARGTVYIAMELLRGETIAERMKKGRVPMAMALRLMRQAASALGAAHSAGIVHRDLKPDNLFVIQDSMVVGGERLKILDFGIAKLVDPDSPDVTKTGATTLLGTPMYMSPEQCRSSTNVDARSDIYTLGCILFELICHRTPFRGDAGELIAMHQLGEIPEPRLYAPDIAPPVRALLRQMMAKAASDRPQTMEEVVDQLEGCLADEDDGPTQMRPSTAPVEPIAAPATSQGGRKQRGPTAKMAAQDDDDDDDDDENVVADDDGDSSAADAAAKPSGDEVTVQAADDLLSTPDTERMAPRARRTEPSSVHPHAEPEDVTVPQIGKPQPAAPIVAASKPESGPHTKPGYAVPRASTTAIAGTPGTPGTPMRPSMASIQREAPAPAPAARAGAGNAKKKPSGATRWLGPIVIATGITLGIAVALGVRECSHRAPLPPQMPEISAPSGP